jgi:SAM-dependent methyltransferase
MFERLTRWHHSLNDRFFARGTYLKEYGAELERSLGGCRVHIGCGDGTTLARYANVPAATIALDLSHDSLLRNLGARRVVGDATRLPFADASIDLVHCEHVLEHLPNPTALMAEVSRVLKPGGRFVFVTPNAWSYVAIAARAVPLHLRHKLIECLRGQSSPADNHPTFYRANSARTLRRLTSGGGLEIVRLDGYVSEPCYTAGLPVVHLLAIAWHRLLECSRMNRALGITLLGVVQKPERSHLHVRNSRRIQ